MGRWESLWSGLANVGYLVTLLTCMPALTLAMESFTSVGLSAPQAAQLAAQAVALVVVPYVGARALDGFARSCQANREGEAQAEQLRKLDSVIELLKRKD